MSHSIGTAATFCDGVIRRSVLRAGVLGLDLAGRPRYVLEERGMIDEIA